MIIAILSATLAVTITIVFYKVFKLILFRINVARRLTGRKGIKLDRSLEAKLIIKRSPTNYKGSMSRLEKLLSETSLEMAPGQFLKVCIIGCMLLGVVLLALIGSIWVAIASVLASPFVIYIILRCLKKTKLKAFSAQLADIIDFFSSGLKSGYSLMQALNIIAEEGANPAASEFKRVIQDVNLGKTYEEAFDRMVARNPIEDLEILIVGIIISKETGGNLTHILEIISSTLREREKIRGEIRGLAAQGKLSGLILALLPIGMFGFMWIMNPSYIMPLITNPIGRIFLLGGIISQVIGGLIIKKIINIEW